MEKVNKTKKELKDYNIEELEQEIQNEKKKKRKAGAKNVIKISCWFGSIIIVSTIVFLLGSRKVKLYKQETKTYGKDGLDKTASEETETPKEEKTITVTSEWTREEDGNYYRTKKTYLATSQVDEELKEEELEEIIKNENNPFDKLFGEPIINRTEKKTELTDYEKENNNAVVSASIYSYDKNEYKNSDKFVLYKTTRIAVTIAVLLYIGASSVMISGNILKLQELGEICQKNIVPFETELIKRRTIVSKKGKC